MERPHPPQLDPCQIEVLPVDLQNHRDGLVHTGRAGGDISAPTKGRGSERRVKAVKILLILIQIFCFHNSVFQINVLLGVILIRPGTNRNYYFLLRYHVYNWHFRVLKWMSPTSL